jgi:hypothetical protein
VIQLSVGVAALVTLVFWTPLDIPPTSRVISAPPENPDTDATYVFYLHGKIVEDQGPHAESPEFGHYEYYAILRGLAKSGFTVISEVRAPNTDPEAYAANVAAQVQHLITSHVHPSNITILGASKGSVIAMLVSSRIRAGVKYIILANCNNYVLRTYPLSLHGDVLSVYEASDPIGQTCRPLFEASPELGKWREIRLETGLGHGFIFRPLDVWIQPAVAWVQGYDAPETERPVRGARLDDCRGTAHSRNEGQRRYRSKLASGCH